jgi:hypothetical protein
MSPLIQYVGNSTSQDNTEIIALSNAPDGTARSIVIGTRALVSGNELRQMASSYQVLVVEDSDETDADTIPTEMPSGYDENGYPDSQEGDTGDAVFTAEAYPDDAEDDAPSTTDAAAASANPVAPQNSPAITGNPVVTNPTAAPAVSPVSASVPAPVSSPSSTPDASTGASS